jgi:hypothetical protein
LVTKWCDVNGMDLVKHLSQGLKRHVVHPGIVLEIIGALECIFKLNEEYAINATEHGADDVLHDLSMNHNNAQISYKARRLLKYFEDEEQESEEDDDDDADQDEDTDNDEDNEKQPQRPQKQSFSFDTAPVSRPLMPRPSPSMRTAPPPPPTAPTPTPFPPQSSRPIPTPRPFMF